MEKYITYRYCPPEFLTCDHITLVMLRSSYEAISDEACIKHQLDLIPGRPEGLRVNVDLDYTKNEHTVTVKLYFDSEKCKPSATTLSNDILEFAQNIMRSIKDVYDFVDQIDIDLDEVVDRVDKLFAIKEQNPELLTKAMPILDEAIEILNKLFANKRRFPVLFEMVDDDLNILKSETEELKHG